MRIAACVIVRNEQESILEWCTHHALLGFDDLIVVDDHSTDRTTEKSQLASRFAKVVLRRYKQPNKGMQALEYLSICAEFKEVYDWIAFIDSDEFLLSNVGSNLRSMLDQRRDVAAVALPWLMFGSGGHKAKPEGLILETYTSRAVTHFPENRHVKSIIRPGKAVSAPNPHCFVVDGAYALPSGEPVVWRENNPGILDEYPTGSPWWINHYFTRSESHWQDRVNRGQLGNVVRTMDQFHHYDRNEEKDDRSLPFAEKVRVAWGMTNF